MKINFLTIFPHIFDSYINESILKRAQNKKLAKFDVINIRDFTSDKHHKVDDAPYGGGAGMVMKAEPIYEALKTLKTKKKNRIVLLSAKGKIFMQKDAKRLSKYDELTFVCGRYEGVDERIKKFVDEEISIGEYVLTGGELPALVISDTVIRLIPGVIAEESLKEESFSLTTRSTLTDKPCLEYPQYTKPEIFEYKKNNKNKKLTVPKVLLSGDHKKIKEWRIKNSK
ncbi:MAG: tRNA (guanosine(37)-N1)-methyltransferase TrmD [Parcubacteria group bacterium CG10_big_fil_rev_8_21_14_0_10_36_14]|nr:MAG: tRNA (guanosine(37)-N1)-methyltransferase TrmD [Parcubacteria group bacterium CG10_big_fil_rev_8_21_14_0_10_36_14]